MWFVVFVYFCFKPFEKIVISGELAKLVNKTKKKMGTGSSADKDKKASKNQ